MEEYLQLTQMDRLKIGYIGSALRSGLDPPGNNLLLSAQITVHSVNRA